MEPTELVKEYLSIWDKAFERTMDSQEELLKTVVTMAGGLSNKLEDQRRGLEAQIIENRRKIEELRTKLVEDIPVMLHDMEERRDIQLKGLLSEIDKSLNIQLHDISSSINLLPESIRQLSNKMDSVTTIVQKEIHAGELRELEHEGLLKQIHLLLSAAALLVIIELPGIVNAVLEFIRNISK